MGGCFFFVFFFFPGNETSFLFNCTKFTLRRVRATIQSLGDLGLWGLKASSEQHLGSCSLEPAVWLNTVLKWGIQTILVARWAAEESGGILPCPPVLCLPQQRSAWRTSQTCSCPLPRASSMKLCFPCGPTKRSGWDDFAALSPLGSGHRMRAVGATAAKRAN